MKTLKIVLTLLISLTGITHACVANAGKGPNMAAFAEDKKVIVIDEQYTSLANDPTGHYTNTLRYSKDYGKSWATAQYPTENNTYNFCGPETMGRDIYAIKYLGLTDQKTFISLGTNGVICTSAYGEAWSMAHPSQEMGDRDPTATVKPFYDVAFDGKDMFVAVGGSGLAMYSTAPDKQWHPVDYSFGGYSLNSIVYGQGKFVVVGNDSNSWFSSDGKTWMQGAGLSGHANFEKVFYEPTANGGTGQFVAVGSYATIWYSNDGEKWAVANLSDPSETYFTDVAYGNGMYVAIGNDNTIAYSKDGKNWVVDTYAFYRSEGGVDILNHPKAIIYAHDKFVVVTSNFDPGIQDGFIFTSVDGAKWNLAPIVGVDNKTPVSENYLASVINTDKGMLAIPYGSGDALADAPAYILYSPILQTKDGDATGLRWIALCDLGFDCMKQ